MKIEVVERVDGWAVSFTIGVQTFFLSSVETRKMAEWYAENLRTAFKNLAG